jgi:hypothetical protein
VHTVLYSLVGGGAQRARGTVAYTETIVQM